MSDEAVSADPKARAMEELARFRCTGAADCGCPVHLLLPGSRKLFDRWGLGLTLALGIASGALMAFVGQRLGSEAWLVWPLWILSACAGASAYGLGRRSALREELLEAARRIAADDTLDMAGASIQGAGLR